MARSRQNAPPVPLSRGVGRRWRFTASWCTRPISEGVRSGRAALMVARLAGGRLARWFYVSGGEMATTDHVLRTRDVGRLSERRGLVMRVRVRGTSLSLWRTGQDAHERTRHDSLHPVPASACPGDVEPYRERLGTGVTGPRRCAHSGMSQMRPTWLSVDPEAGGGVRPVGGSPEPAPALPQRGLWIPTSRRSSVGRVVHHRSGG